MSLKAAIYARYSSDLQSDASIEDQVRVCSQKAEKESWSITNCYSDAAISGASLMRPGIQALLQAAMNGEFDIVLCEAMDRLSRDQADIAGIFKRMEFAGVRIITLSEGEINTMHIGLKGTMNALFLKDLADKTRRGLRGKIEKGKSGGGLSYGYRVVQHVDQSGEAIKGDREIDTAQADIIRRIFHEYGYLNKSPKAIAAQLNTDNILCPSGKQWGASTINGNRRRGTGLLNNELYIGQLVWNRNRMLKDPETGRRTSRQNPESEWVRQEVSHLRIISDDLWAAAKLRQKKLDEKSSSLAKVRPQYLLSGLIECGRCGGGFSKINSSRYGCSNAKNKGAAVCTNRKTIAKETLERYVLQGLQSHMLKEDMLDVFCEEYVAHMNRLSRDEGAAKLRQEQDLTALRSERENLIQALKDGVPAALIKGDLEAVSAKLELAEKALIETPAPKPALHPSMAKRYSAAITDLRKCLDIDGARSEAAQILRELIDKITLTPREDEESLRVCLHGDMASILSLSQSEPQIRAAKNFTHGKGGGNMRSLDWPGVNRYVVVDSDGDQPPLPI